MRTEELIYQYMDYLKGKKEECKEIVVEEVSPTLSFINGYLSYINEQQGDNMLGDTPVDATDVTEQPPEEPAPLTVEGEKYLIGLLVKAFLHIPDETEGKIVKELQSTMLDQNPKDVAESIESMLEISQGDMKNVLRSTTGIN